MKSGSPGYGAVVLAASLLVLLAGCAGYRQSLDACLRQDNPGRFEEALGILEKSPLAREERNRLLYLMEKGALLRLAGDYQRSNETLEQADQLEEELFTRSLSAEGLSFLTNDYVVPYTGEDYEAAYLSYLKALNYLELDDLEGALVECRRVDEKLNFFSDRYGGKNVYKEDAFLRLLTGLIYEAEGDSNNAFIAYRRSLQTYRDYQDKYGVEVPPLLWGRLLTAARRTGFDEEYRTLRAEALAAGVEPVEGGPMAAVIVNAGRIPAKRAAEVVVPVERGVVKLALPAFRPYLPLPAPEVTLDKGRQLTTARVQDLAAVARQSLEDKKGRVLAKVVARAVAKQVAARKAERELGPLAGFLTQIGALLTEQADLRSWTLLPGEIRLAVVPLPPGPHTLTLNGHAGRENRSIVGAGRDVVFVIFDEIATGAISPSSRRVAR